MAQKAAVSAFFNKFLASNNNKIEEAKKAENRMMNCPLPIGVTGQVTFTSMEFAETKAKADKDPIPYCKLSATVIDDPMHKGKKLKKWWFFNDTANMDAAGRYQMFMDDLEAMGLPREIREKGGPNDIHDYFISEKEPRVARFEIIKDDYNRQEGKSVRFSVPQVVGEGDDSILPPDQKLAEGRVMYLGTEYELVSEDSTTGKSTIKSLKTGGTSEVDSADLVR